MKQIITSFLLMALGCAGAFGAINSLRVVTTDGDSYVFSFEADPQISFETNVLKVTVDDANPSEFDIEEVDFFDFVENTESGVVDAKMTLNWDSRTLTLSNLEKDTQVSLYTLDGRCLLSRRASDSFTLSRDSLPKGVYILKANNFSVKIAI